MEDVIGPLIRQIRQLLQENLDHVPVRCRHSRHHNRGSRVLHGGGKLEKELLNLHNNQIEQRSQNLNKQLSNLEMMLAHWAFDTSFDYSLSDRDFVRDFEKTRDITNTLLVMQGSNTMIRNVSLYLRGSQPVLFYPEYSALHDGSVISLYDRLLDAGKTTYWTQLALDPDQPGKRELTFVHLVPGAAPNRSVP